MAASQISYYQRVQALTEEICRHHPYQEGSDPRIGAAIEDLKKASDNLRKANICFISHNVMVGSINT